MIDWPKYKLSMRRVGKIVAWKLKDLNKPLSVNNYSCQGVIHASQVGVVLWALGDVREIELEIPGDEVLPLLLHLQMVWHLNFLT